MNLMLVFLQVGIYIFILLYLINKFGKINITLPLQFLSKVHTGVNIYTLKLNIKRIEKKLLNSSTTLLRFYIWPLKTIFCFVYCYGLSFIFFHW